MEFTELKYDFKEYLVYLRPNSIVYEQNNKQIFLPFFYVKIDAPDLRGKIEINWRSQWGCQMSFIYFEPGDLKGMFDFIGKGYNVF